MQAVDGGDGADMFRALARGDMEGDRMSRRQADRRDSQRDPQGRPSPPAFVSSGKEKGNRLGKDVAPQF